MPSKQLTNPGQAYGYAADTGVQTIDFVVGATAVTVGAIVSLDANGNVVPTAANGDVKMVGVVYSLGIKAGATGDVVEVCIGGTLTTLVASAAIAAGVVISGSATPGRAGAASAVIGANIGVSITAAAGNGNVFTAYIAKM